MVKLYNILIYFLLFTIVLLLFNRSSRVEKWNGQHKRWNAYAVIAIIILCIFSAMRASTVGTDTNVYLARYNLALKYDFSQYFLIIWEKKEIGFAGFVYAISKLTSGNTFIFLFTSQLLSVIPIYVVATKNKETCSITHIMFYYLFIFYPMSFNIIRQAITAAFLLLAYTELKDKKKSLAIVFALLSIAFHQSSVLGIILIFAVIAINSISDSLVRKLIIMLMICCLALFAVDINGVASYLLSGDGLFGTTKLASYFSRYQNGTLGDYLTTIDAFAIGDFVFRILFVLVPLSVTNSKVDRNLINDYRMFVIISLLIDTVVVFVFNSSYGFRVTLYLDIMTIVYFAQISHGGSSKALTVSKSFFVIALMALSYFIYIYIAISAHDAIPYSIGV